jgi:DNA (cytosine-5)-methyltransferase 1
VPKAVSLFSGCGGSDAGLLSAGFDVVMANDILPYAKDVYLANHPETDFVFGDVRKIEHFPKAELLVGCYPPRLQPRRSPRPVAEDQYAISGVCEGARAN